MRETHEFIVHIFKIDLEKEKDDILFETWLHKIWDMDYMEYRKKIEEGIKTSKTKMRMSDEEEKKNLEKANKILGIKSKEV